MLRFVDFSYQKNSQCKVNKYDFIFADTSEDFEGCGNCVCIDTNEPIYAGYHTILAKKNNQENDAYLAYLFASSRWRGQLRSIVNGVKVFSVTQSLLRSTVVILPPIEEQKEGLNSFRSASR